MLYWGTAQGAAALPLQQKITQKVTTLLSATTFFAGIKVCWRLRTVDPDPQVEHGRMKDHRAAPIVPNAALGEQSNGPSTVHKTPFEGFVDPLSAIELLQGYLCSDVVSSKNCHFLYCSALHACLTAVHSPLFISHPLRYFVFLCNGMSLHFPSCSPSTGKNTSLLSRALRDFTGATSLNDERIGYYLATWAL